MEVNSPLGSTKSNNPLNQLENALADISKKLPQLPAGVKEFIVKFGPYLIVLSVIAGVLGTISALGAGSLFSMPNYVSGYYVRWGYYWTVDTLVMAATTILDALALSGLFKRQKKGWQFLFYSSLVTIAGQLLLVNILSAIITAAISLYLIFQIREYYK